MAAIALYNVVGFMAFSTTTVGVVGVLSILMRQGR